MGAIMRTYEELVEENTKLRRKLSPLEDKDFTDEVVMRMAGLDLNDHERSFRGKQYIVIYPAEMFKLLFGRVGNSFEVTKLGRSLQALCWERSALHGDLCFVMEVDEYRETLQ